VGRGTQRHCVAIDFSASFTLKVAVAPMVAVSPAKDAA